jgi:fructose-specific component phosphotransferase system IIB-like protein
MTHRPHQAHPPADVCLPPADVCLLLRAHAEQRWLSREVVPVLRQLESIDELPEEQLGAALAYLEVTWLEATRHAAETDAAFAALEDAAPGARETLSAKARRYHAAVRLLREAAGRRVARLIAAPGEAEISCVCGDGAFSAGRKAASRTVRPEVRPV